MIEQSAWKQERKLAYDLIQQFEKLAPLNLQDRKRGKDLHSKDINGKKEPRFKGWRQLSTETSIRIKTEYENPHGALSAKKRLLAELRGFSVEWLGDPQTYHAVKTIVVSFADDLNLLFFEMQNSINKAYNGRVEDRSEDGVRIDADLTPWLKKAQEVLTLAASGASKKDLKWEDVSCALALATGRRMSEIHCSGRFAVAGDYALMFSGQLKGKSREVKGQMLIDHEFSIPTLVKADLCLAGIQWLDANGKRLDEETGTPDQVNKKFAKYAGNRSKTDWCVIKDEEWQSVDVSDKWTYHKFRGLYLIASVENLEGHYRVNVLDAAPKILGDKNVEAIKPYVRVNLTPKSLTRV